MTYGPKRGKLIEQYIELYNEELYGFCFSQNVIQVINSRRVREAGNRFVWDR